MILDRIMRQKDEDIQVAKRRKPLSALRQELPERKAGLFYDRLATPDKITLIAEIKKASPSKGLIREDFDPATLALGYESGGADALSVLTDETFFRGHLDHLAAASQVTKIPCLRKEFILDPYQVYEACVAGADAILLIVACLHDAGRIEDLQALAFELGLDTLVEVHTEAELDVALEANATIIGVNNRDLTTFETTLDTTFALAENIPRDRVLVSESGIFTYEHVVALAQAGVDACLVGESLMRQTDVTKAVQTLLYGADDSSVDARPVPNRANRPVGDSNERVS